MIEYNKKLGAYVSEGEVKFTKFIKPQCFIEDSISNNKKIKDQLVINFLQDELKELLQSFLNGGFSYKGFIFYPLIKDVSKENKKKIKNLFVVINYLNNRNYDFSGSISNFKKYKFISSRNFAVLISSLYKDFGNIKKNKIIKKTIKKIDCKEISVSDYKDKQYIKPVFDLKNFAEKKLKKYLLGFYLHGSLSTKDYVKGWSDLDTLAVINKKTINNYQDLLSLRDCLYKSRRFFYLIDPLQHHSHFILTEYDLDYYPESYFPSVLFKYSKSFFNPDRINKINTREDNIERIQALFYFVNYFRNLYSNKKYRLGSYDAKFLLHAITLFPALYLQAKGKNVYKKYSFDMAKKDFDDKEWQIIKDVEDVRKNWSKTKTSFIRNYSKINPLLAYQLNAKFLDYFGNIKNTNKKDVKFLVDSMFELSEKAWKKIKWKIS